MASSSFRLHRPSLFAAIRNRNQSPSTLIQTASSNNDGPKDDENEESENPRAVNGEPRANDELMTTDSCNESINDQYGNTFSYFPFIRQLNIFCSLLISVTTTLALDLSAVRKRKSTESTLEEYDRSNRRTLRINGWGTLRPFKVNADHRFVFATLESLIRMIWLEISSCHWIPWAAGKIQFFR